jgi:hypothetical protein
MKASREGHHADRAGGGVVQTHRIDISDMPLSKAPHSPTGREPVGHTSR